ncbi:hypothetical protein [Methylobacter sp.]|uniref:hypothetical protein n=1 Tax=Methylobacter sp. TaxID=2051955 RepID=UPI003DA22F86
MSESRSQEIKELISLLRKDIENMWTFRGNASGYESEYFEDYEKRVKDTVDRLEKLLNERQ